MRYFDYRFWNLKVPASISCLALLGGTTALAQDFSNNPSTGLQSDRTIQFTAPATPIATVGGGVRGSESDAIVFTVLAPEQVGLTTQAQPTLCWYQSASAESMAFELTLNLDDETILEQTLSQASNSGIQKLDLAASDITFKPEVYYEWIIALIPDPNDRAQDIISSTLIQRVPVTDTLGKALQAADDQQYASVYANEGIWYDALASLETAIEATPDNEKLQLDRIALFEQAGLKKVVECERQGH